MNNYAACLRHFPFAAEGAAPIEVHATAASGLWGQVASSNTFVISVLGHVASIVGPGTATLSAVQGANAQYEGAAAVTQTVTVEPLMVPLSGAPDWLGDYVLTIQGNLNRPYKLLYQKVLLVGTWPALFTINNLPAPSCHLSVSATNTALFFRLERPVYSLP